MGFWAASSVWHSAGVKGSEVVETPVGIPCTTTFDHLVSKSTEMEVDLRTLVGNRERRALRVVSDDDRSWSAVVSGPAVTIRLPAAVHFVAEMRT